VLLLVGQRRSAKSEDEHHPFGHARERFFFAFLVAVILFTAGAGFALREGLHKLTHPHEVESPAVAIGILVVAMALEAFSLRTAVVAANKQRTGRTWWRFIRETKAADLVETKSLLIGEAASPEEAAAIRRAITVGGPFHDVVHLRTEHRGPEELLVAAKVAVDPNAHSDDVARAIDEAEARIRAALPSARYIFIEPDIRRA
jgi:divalent metal cation (Fe/Co/Zn/Cd) transporter